MAKGLTTRQGEILEFIIECIRDKGFPPTLAEIGQAFSISSTNGVNDHLLALERKGFIKRTSKARSIQVTEKAAAGLYHSEVNLVPLVGQVAAGSPILAEENVEEQIPVGVSMARNASYCLRVRGDSMIDDGILDGDIVVVAQTPAKPGDVVVALVDDEATVKRYHPRGAVVELRPANRTMSPIEVPAASLNIQGVVVALQRRIVG